MNKDDVLKEIVDYYLGSRDYNGLPVYNMKHYSYALLCELIDENKIEVLSDEVLNPHVKCFPITVDKEIQKKNIARSKHAVLYPTEEFLKSQNIQCTAPYSQLMKLGCHQFKVLYFDIEILERYINNPKFFIFDDGYRGNIYIKDEYCDEEETLQYEYIKDYGMAYPKKGKFNRAIGVFVYDLAKLSEQKQQLWKGFELQNQSNWDIHPGFIKNLILGDWVTEFWVYHAVLLEMSVINEFCDAMQIPKLFNHTYGIHPTEIPEGYRNIFLPTKKNFYDFVLVLEKILVHNISYKIFQKTAPNVKPIERQTTDGKDKGSLSMLEEWLDVNSSAKLEDIQKIIIEPLKRIRKIRQVPAHELISNDYDLDYYKQQNELMGDVYSAIASVRRLLSTHPNTKTVEVPDVLDDVENIVGY